MKILFMGRKQVSANLLRFLTKQDHIEIVGVLTDSHLQGSPTTAAAQELGLPLYTFDTALEAMREGRLKYDLGLSVLYWRKLRDEFLSIPTLGTINFHPALLPEYKGTGGYNLAIMDELNQWGNTAHYVDASIDTGEIIEVDRFPIDAETETAQSLERKPCRRWSRSHNASSPAPSNRKPNCRPHLTSAAATSAATKWKP